MRRGKKGEARYKMSQGVTVSDGGNKAGGKSDIRTADDHTDERQTENVLNREKICGQKVIKAIEASCGNTRQRRIKGQNSHIMTQQSTWFTFSTMFDSKEASCCDR